jgi:transposase
MGRLKRFEESLNREDSLSCLFMIHPVWEDHFMPAPLPKELRNRFARLIGEGLTGREAARRLQVSAATGGRWARQIRRLGQAVVAPMGRPPGTGKLAAHVDFFQELVTQDPDITLFELRDALAHATDVTVHHSAIAGLLKRLGFTHKKSRWLLPSVAAPK